MSVINGGSSVLHSLWTGVTGLNAFGTALEVVGDNITNVNTIGFKGRRLVFADIFSDVQGMYAQMTSAVAGPPGPSQVGEGVRIADIRTDFVQGELQATPNPLDLAIDGNGFFVVKENPDAPELYTRAGQFDIGEDEEGRFGIVVNPQGLQLQVDQSGAIGALDLSAEGLKKRFGNDFVFESISVEGDGTVKVSSATGRLETIGKVQMVKFHDPEALIPMGNGIFTQSHDSGLPLPPDTPTGGVVYDHALELSNVDLTTQFVNLIEYQRAFQVNNKVISASDEILQTLVQMKG